MSMSTVDVEELSLKLDRAENDVVYLAAQNERLRGMLVRALDLHETVRVGFDQLAAEIDL